MTNEYLFMYLNAICISLFCLFKLGCLTYYWIIRVFLKSSYKFYIEYVLWMIFSQSTTCFLFSWWSGIGIITLSFLNLRTPPSLSWISLPTACLDIAPCSLPLVHQLCFLDWTFSQSLQWSFFWFCVWSPYCPTIRCVFSSQNCRLWRSNCIH